MDDGASGEDDRDVVDVQDVVKASLERARRTSSSYVRPRRPSWRAWGTTRTDDDDNDDDDCGMVGSRGGSHRSVADEWQFFPGDVEERHTSCRRDKRKCYSLVVTHRNS